MKKLAGMFALLVLGFAGAVSAKVAPPNLSVNMWGNFASAPTGNTVVSCNGTFTGLNGESEQFGQSAVVPPSKAVSHKFDYRLRLSGQGMMDVDCIAINGSVTPSILTGKLRGVSVNYAPWSPGIYVLVQ